MYLFSQETTIQCDMWYIGVNTEYQGHFGCCCCLTNYPTCCGVKQQLFYCAYRFSELGIQKLVSVISGASVGKIRKCKGRRPIGWNYMKVYSLIYLAPGLRGLKGCLWMSPICALTCSLQRNLRGLGLITWMLMVLSTKPSVRKVALTVTTWPQKSCILTLPHCISYKLSHKPTEILWRGT